VQILTRPPVRGPEPAYAFSQRALLKPHSFRIAFSARELGEEAPNQGWNRRIVRRGFFMRTPIRVVVY